MSSIISLGLVAIAVLMLYILIKLFKTPLKWVFKFIINGICGFFTLLVLNYFGGMIGITLGVNWPNAIIVGLLGFPGVVLLLLVKFFL